MDPVDPAEHPSPVVPNKERCKIDVVIMATADIDEYAKETVADWQSYCSQYGYSLAHFDEQVIPELHINWSKIELAKRHLRQSECDWMWLRTPIPGFVTGPGVLRNSLMINPARMPFSPVMLLSAQAF